MGHISSEAGVQQGDPALGPLLFALVLQKILNAIDALGIFVNPSKCEVFCKGDTSEFPPSTKSSHVPHHVLLGAPIGDCLFCGNYAAPKRSEAMRLLSRLVEVGASDPQVALILL